MVALITAMPSPRDEIVRVVQEVLAPLVEADGGELYLVRADDAKVSLHLAGRFAGCPGNTVVTRRVIEPAIQAVAPKAEVVITAGYIIPKDATRVSA